MTLWTQELERVDRCKVDKYEEEHKDDLNDSEIWDSNVLHEESSGVPIKDYVTRSEGKKIMEDNIKTTGQLTARCTVTEIVKKRLRTYSR